MLQGPSSSEFSNAKEGSQNVKPLSNLRVTLEQYYCVNLGVTLEQSYLAFEAQELCTATWQAQKHILPVDKSPSILPLVYSLVLSDSVFCM